MNGDLLSDSLGTVSGEDVQASHQKKFVHSQNLLSTTYSMSLGGGGVSMSYSLAGNNQQQSQSISLQQIKDLLLQETRKSELFISKERVPFNHGIGAAFPSVTESLSLNLPPSQVLSQSSDVANHHVTDESSDLTSLISINTVSAPRMTSHHESFQGSGISDSSPLLRGSMSCENSLSDLTPSITPVNLIDTSTDSLIFEKEVFSNDQTTQSSFHKDNVINSITKDDKDATNSTSNIVNNNRLLSKLIQSYKSESNSTMPLRIHEFAKIPNASLKPSLPSDINGVGKISLGSSPSVPLSLHSVVSSSSHLSLHNNLTDFNCGTSGANSVSNSLDALSVMTTTSAETFVSSNHVTLSNSSQQSLQNLGDLNFADHFENRVQQSSHHVLSDQLLSKQVKRSNQHNSLPSMSKDSRFSFTEARSEPLLISGDQLIQGSPITSAIESTNPLNFIPDQQILSHISHLNGITSDNVKGDRSLRPVDVFLSDLHASDDHDLLRGPLSNTIVPDMPSNLVSSTSSIVSETTLSTSIGSTGHLPELPPSPILANISPDFLVGGSSSVPKSSPGGQAPFLPSLSTATENLALSFSSHFLENSNMSIDMGSLSEGDGSLNVPHSFSDSLDSSSAKKSTGHELTFTNALKGVTERSNCEKLLHKIPGTDNNALNSFGTTKGSHIENLSFKGNSLLSRVTTSSPEIFKVPPQMKHSLTDDSILKEIFKVPPQMKHNLTEDGILSPVKRNSFSAKEIPLIKIDSESSPPRKAQSPKVTDSLVQEVSCFKCQLCSYLSLDKSEINEHMKHKHENSLLETMDSTSTTKRMPVSPASAASVKEEVPPPSKRRKKEKGVTKKTSNKASSATKKIKREPPIKSQMKVEILPREKGGFQRSIVLVDEIEEARATSMSLTPTSASLPSIKHASFNYHSQNAKDNELHSDSNSSDTKSSTSDESIFSDHPRLPTTAQGKELKHQYSSKNADTPSKKEEVPKTFHKTGRPTASQTLGIIKFKKSHPSITIPEDALGIRCGVNGCGLRLKEEENILYHRKCHVDAFLKCPECHTKFTHWASLAMHLWRMHMIDMELHKCDKCNFKSYSYTKLMNGHWKTHSTERPFLCDVCGKDFKTAKQLRSHKVLHVEKNEELKHHCDMCQRKFAEKRMLLLHLEAVHKKVKPYLCNYCGNSFASKSTLNLHIRKHTGEKPFACESCNYRTSDHNSMRRHKMKHTNDRPYSCPYCDYSSIQSSTFKVHLRRKHEMQAQKDGVIFSCSMCPFKTVKKDNYLAHVGTHHKTSEDVQNKEAERQQQQINKSGDKKQAQKPQLQQQQQEQQYQQQHQQQQQQQQQHNLERKLSAKLNSERQQRVITASGNPQHLQTLSSIQNISHSQQIFIAKTQASASLTDCSSSGATTILVANGNPKTQQSLPQQPMFYVLRELVPLPHIVNIDVNEESGSEVSPELVNGVFLQSNMSNPRTVILSSNAGDQFTFSNAGESVLQSVTINDGVVQLTPEVVAMPVTTELTPLSQALTSQTLPGLIYVTTSNETDNSPCKIGSNSSLFS